MDCVKCAGTLKSKVLGKVIIDSCATCRGIWFDKQELRQLLASAIQQADELFGEGTGDAPNLDQQQGSCPRCSITLSRHESLAVDGLTYDQCMQCRGAWLDGGELARLVRDPATAEMLTFFNEMD